MVSKMHIPGRAIWIIVWTTCISIGSIIARIYDPYAGLGGEMAHRLVAEHWRGTTVSIATVEGILLGAILSRFSDFGEFERYLVSNRIWIVFCLSSGYIAYRVWVALTGLDIIATIPIASVIYFNEDHVQNWSRIQTVLGLGVYSLFGAILTTMGAAIFMIPFGASGVYVPRLIDHFRSKQSEVKRKARHQS